MTLKVQVKWVNPKSALLPDDRAKIQISGAQETSRGEGMREFEILGTPSSVDLKAKFSASFKAVQIALGVTVAAQEHVVWQAEQSYEIVNGTELKAKADFTSSGGHPLVEITSAASVNGAAEILLRTEFVALGHFWKLYATGVRDYLAERNPSTKLTVLGYTGGRPLIWFASVPKVLQKPPSPFVSCLVFYRPANDGYTKVDQRHEMSRLNRFLLAQVPGSNDHERGEIFRPYKARPNQIPIYGYLRCGFEDALAQSNKPVVMLHPWPHGGDFGEANGSKLPSLVAAAIRFLWATGAIDTPNERAFIRAGRLGLSAFSAGGRAMWPTLKAVGDRVHEVYSFDSNGIDAPAAIQWFGQSPTTRCLRMTGGYQIAAHQAIKRAIEQTSGATSRVTAWPASPTAYQVGKTPAWEQALSLLPDTPTKKWQSAVRANHDYWHQFAIFGGSGAVSDAIYVSFLQDFLQGSDF